MYSILAFLQYPLRPSKEPYTSDGILNARVCGEGEGVELDMKVRPRGVNYSTSRGEHYARVVALGSDGRGAGAGGRGSGGAYERCVHSVCVCGVTAGIMHTPHNAINMKAIVQLVSYIAFSIVSWPFRVTSLVALQAVNRSLHLRKNPVELQLSSPFTVTCLTSLRCPLLPLHSRLHAMLWQLSKKVGPTSLPSHNSYNNTASDLLT